MKKAEGRCREERGYLSENRRGMPDAVIGPPHDGFIQSFYCGGSVPPLLSTIRKVSTEPESWKPSRDSWCSEAGLFGESGLAPTAFVC